MHSSLESDSKSSSSSSSGSPRTARVSAMLTPDYDSDSDSDGGGGDYGNCDRQRRHQQENSFKLLPRTTEKLFDATEKFTRDGDDEFAAGEEEEGLGRRRFEDAEVDGRAYGAGGGHRRRLSAETTRSYQLYTPDEERAVVRKFDRRLVAFVAFLYMLSFLDRSSTLQPL